MNTLLSPQTLLFAFLGGILPTLLWLWFWLREDKKKPEPRGRIIATFLAGMFVVAIAIPAERYIQNNIGASLVGLVFAWSAVEELLKFGAAWYGGLRRKAMDEPIDAMIYLITAALGFAALENTLFLLGVSDKGLVALLTTGNMRFLGATLLHVVSSSIVGGAIALSYYRKKLVRWEYVFVGVILAIALHALFNFFIMNNTAIFVIFSAVWVGVIALLLTFERIKHIRRP